ncbi:phosphatase domain-containing protein [Jhaorihella thermophila]|uniref:Dual specificity phosphatase, catalytic domain n=1 Tax=Jhaorihella thermophila TaxID=488547 RepID=A0A1H5TZQ5_9RHOB|nr:protein-tyrosine phosphatase family protein [Jhaorihella thermophila]SEF68305.1 Dual specificity phosphatase, catalytic domain [Jhaorihella thermophila]
MPGMVIHALQAGRGTLAICPLPGRGGRYRGDLDLIRDWKPGLVLTLTTDSEMAKAGAQLLGTDIQSMGSRWRHLPIADFGTPAPRVERLWPEASQAARQALQGGGRVLVHCNGGCGRSGMIALRLLVEIGEDPQAALEHLRRVRPCAIETDAQMQWALAGRSGPRRPGRLHLS